MLSVTVETSEATYAHDGRSGDIDLLLWPARVNGGQIRGHQGGVISASVV